jgi:drug/metabolite transporter (DMT)-like permease
VAVIWGINIPIMKTGLDHVNIFVFNAIRLGISAAVLVVFAWRELGNGLALPEGISWRQVLIYALLSCGFYQLLFLVGIAWTTSGNTALIMATIPMWTALLARGFLGEMIQRLAWTGLVIALAGTIIVSVQTGSLSAGRDHLWGNLLILVAALFWAGGTVYSRPLLRKISPLQLSALASALALPVHFVAAWGHYESSRPELQSLNIWLILLYSGVLSSGLALPLWNVGVRHAGAAHAAIIQNLIPLIAIAAAWISRGEKATSAQVLGGTLILGGLLLMRFGRLKAAQD